MVNHRREIAIYEIISKMEYTNGGFYLDGKTALALFLELGISNRKIRKLVKKKKEAGK